MFGRTTWRWNSAYPILLEKMNRIKQILALVHGRFSVLYKRDFVSVVKEKELYSGIRTRSVGNTTVIQLCAHSFMTSLERLAVLNAIDKPAHLAPGSFERINEWIRMVHLCTCP